MPNSLYLEPASGIAGDMMLSALCSLADAFEDIQELPKKLDLPDARIEVQSLNKNGIVCRHVKIIDLGESRSDHHHHHHDHGHVHGPHRHLSDILALIENGELSQRSKEIAKSIFQMIGEAESRIHNIPIEKIHFHEVSGVDSILDIVGCAELIDRLDITQTYSDPVCVGFGNVDTQHGRLPVPAPATAEILKGIPCFKGEETGERCTPTGAAILKFLNPKFEAPPSPARSIAYGPGTKDFKAANVLRASLLEPAETDSQPQVWIVETNIDDMPAEFLGSDFQNGLMEAGAVDFHLAQVQMKKGRPGLLLSALATSETLDSVADYLLENTSTIGLRYYPAKRRVLKRRKIAIETELGTLLAKETELPSGKVKTKIEYEALRELAAKHDITITELRKRIGASLDLNP